MLLLQLYQSYLIDKHKYISMRFMNNYAGIIKLRIMSTLF